ncbi:MAG: RNA polymerase sigma-70 factor [Thermoleophilaceae bacterium]
MTHDELRPLLFSMAYRMVGTVGDAEDLVQEAFLRLHREQTEGTEIESPKAFLTTVVTRLAIDHLRSARVRREEYVGEWLPEPLLVDPDPGPADHAEMSDTLSLAFLVLLESLSPVERAVFLLHDVFGYSYAEIGDVVGKTEAACRQIAVRARKAVDERRPRFDPSAEERRRVAERFFAALAGDVSEIEAVLSEDVVMHGDGGGKAPAIARPLEGAARVSRFWANLFKQGARAGMAAELSFVNGQPGAVIRTSDRLVVTVVALDIVDGRVRAIRSIVNPDKLRHLGPVADVNALLRARRG